MPRTILNSPSVLAAVVFRLVAVLAILAGGCDHDSGRDGSEVDGGGGKCELDDTSVPETCDGLDNDCDSSTDEGELPGVDVDCDTGDHGQCAPGTTECFDGEIHCTAQAAPSPEICDDIDNDCDGETDDELPTPFGDACSEPEECPKTLQCADGAIQCLPRDQEICDGNDNDCDTLADETFPGQGSECYPCVTTTFPADPEGPRSCDPADSDPPSIIYDGTVCEAGGLQCVGGDELCGGWVGPSPEVCNGLDDDCDGEVDDGAECTGEAICFEGACVNPCQPGEFPCGFGFYCATVPDEGNFCLPDPCLNVTCEEGFFCDSKTGECTDLCAGVSCLEGAICLEGYCLDCFTYACDEGEVCQTQSNGVGVCQPL